MCHPVLVSMCEVIVYGNSEYELYNEGWSVDNKRNAQAHLNMLLSFEFVYTLVALQRSLLYLKEGTVKLQGQHQDIASGVALMEQCSSTIKSLRENIDDYAHRIFEHSCRIADRSQITIAKPRLSLRQQHRSNLPTDSVEEYFKVTVTIPFLDHLLNDLTSHFSAHVKQSASVQKLLPVNIESASTIDGFNQALFFYKDDLPNSDLVDEEFHLWKSRWLAVSKEERPLSISKAMQQCSPTKMPNIYTLLKLFATLSLSSCSCERSASTLRRLNTYLRCTQTEHRLTALALIHCNYNETIDANSLQTFS